MVTAIQKLNPRKHWSGVKSTKMVPYVKLSSEEIRDLISVGYRIKSKTLYVFGN